MYLDTPDRRVYSGRPLRLQHQLERRPVRVHLPAPALTVNTVHQTADTSVSLSAHLQVPPLPALQPLQVNI